MPSGVSSKHIKNHSDEERSKKKKMKSSGKRRRRARDSSPSDSVASRGRRKSSRREPKSSRRSPSRGDDRKRRRDSKKPDKKKSRKPRSRRDASVSSTNSSGSSRSCSTCHGRSGSTDRSISGRSRSLSPIRSDRKVRLKARGRSRGRDRGRKSRYRSPSCPTCSGYSSGSSPSRRRHKKKSKERDTARTKSHDKGSDKIIRDDDFRPSRSNDGYNDGRKCEKEQAVVRKGAWNARGEDGSYKMMGEDIVSSEANTTSAINAAGSSDDSRQRRMGLMKERSARMNSEVVANTLPAAKTYDGQNDSLGHQSRKNPEVVASSNNLEAEDLELILRQKALENLRKFRIGLSASSRSLGDRKGETVSTESSKDGGCEISKGSIKSIVCNPASSLENHRPTHVEAPPVEGRIEFCANPLAGDPNDNVSFTLSDGHKITSSKDGRDAQHQVKKVHESFTKTSLKQSSLSKDIQKKRDVAESGSSKGREVEVNIAEGSSCLDMEIGNCKSDQTMADATSRSQFEQKTFSRMQDGEVVQVSYKVYIPNKRPTLARRELQR